MLIWGLQFRVGEIIWGLKFRGPKCTICDLKSKGGLSLLARTGALSQSKNSVQPKSKSLFSQTQKVNSLNFRTQKVSCCISILFYLSVVRQGPHE